MIGIVVDNVVNNSQNYILFRELNKLAEEHECYLFANTVQALPIKHHKFAILQHIEALSHRGVLIGTSMLTSQIVSNALMATDKYYYVWGPDWLTIKHFGPQQLNKVYYDKEVKLIARSTSHFDLLHKLFKEPCGTISNWNAEKLLEVISCQTAFSN